LLKSGLMLVRSLFFASAALLVVACTANVDDPSADPTDPATSADEALTKPRSVRLMYEGTCDFLHNCSSWSRRLPAGEVQWGCGGTACNDDDLWMAGPSHGYCNRKVKVCRGTQCVTAVVKDISDAKGWEASNGLLDALGLDHTVNVRACSGSGGGTVTVQAL
jgi:hypothetical protein